MTRTSMSSGDLRRLLFLLASRPLAIVGGATAAAGDGAAVAGDGAAVAGREVV